MNPDVAADLARLALAALAACPDQVRVEVGRGGRRCVVCVSDGPAELPALSPRRAGCRADILAALAAAGEPLTRFRLLRSLRQRHTPHGAGTVAKALAELVRGGQLANPKDKRGYRLAGWVAQRRSYTPDLFD